MTTVTRIVPRTNGTSTLTVERAEWSPVEEIVKERFGARLRIHLHTGPGAYHGREFVPVAHYLLELQAEPDQIDEITTAIDPMVDEIIRRNIHTNTVPVER